jgi:hypothetical protein
VRKLSNLKQPKEATQTIKIWVKTQRKLKLLAALTHESMLAVLERLVAQELQQVERHKQEEQ